MKIKIEDDDGREIAIETATVVETKPGDRIVISLADPNLSLSAYHDVAKVINKFFAPIPVLIFCNGVDITVTREAI